MPLASAMERADAVTLASVWKTLWSGMDLSHVVEQWRNEFTIEDVHEVLRFLLVITLSGEQDASKRTMQLEQRLNDVRTAHTALFAPLLCLPVCQSLSVPLPLCVSFSCFCLCVSVTVQTVYIHRMSCVSSASKH